MTLWEWRMVRYGYSLTQSQEDQTKPTSGITEEEFEELMTMELEEHTIEFDGAEIEKRQMQKRGR